MVPPKEAKGIQLQYLEIYLQLAVGEWTLEQMALSELAVRSVGTISYALQFYNRFYKRFYKSFAIVFTSILRFNEQSFEAKI